MTAALHDIVLLGGGHAHVEVLRAFGMRPQSGVRLTLIGRDIHTPYSGMLPGLIAGHYDLDETHIDLAPLCRFAGARLYRDSAVAVDPVARLVRCAERPPVLYDTLSIDTGATPSFAGVAGAADHAIPVKPIDRFAARWAALREALLQGDGPASIGVVGAGAGGVELLLAVRHALLITILEAMEPCVAMEHDVIVQQSHKSLCFFLEVHYEVTEHFSRQPSKICRKNSKT